MGPEDVLDLARRLASRFDGFGAIERQDYVSAGCLAFYQGKSMWGAMRQLRHQEAHHHYGGVARPVVQGFASSLHRSPAGGDSASPNRSAAPHRRRTSRTEHNRTYYFTHYEWYARRDYQDHQAKYGAAALPWEVWRERRERHRKGMAA